MEVEMVDLKFVLCFKFFFAAFAFKWPFPLRNEIQLVSISIADLGHESNPESWSLERPPYRMRSLVVLQFHSAEEALIA